MRRDLDDKHGSGPQLPQVTKPKILLAFLAALKSKVSRRPLRHRLAALRARHPLPRRTGRVADKAFFDALSGDK